MTTEVTTAQVGVQMPLMEASLVAAVQRAVAAGEMPASVVNGPEWAALVAQLAGRKPGDKAAMARTARAIAIAAHVTVMEVLRPIAAEHGKKNLFVMAVAAVESGWDLPLGEEIDRWLDPIRCLVAATRQAERSTVPGAPDWDGIAGSIIAALVQTAGIAGTWDGINTIDVIQDGLWLRLRH